MESTDNPEAMGDLKNKPLVEAIFELGWSVADADSLWDVLPGLYYGAVRDEYPHIENLPMSQVPVQVSLNAVRHRFRKTKDGWPLTQLGPGVLTVNDTAGYTVWKDFLPRITKAVSSLTNVYENVYEKAEPFNRAELRYINAVEFDPQQQSFAKFVKEKLHTSIDLPNLSDGEATTTDIVNANIAAQVQLKRPVGIGEIVVALGQVEEKPAAIFQINVRSSGKDAPKNIEELQKWAKDAHRIIDSWFLSFCEGDLLKSFR